MKKEEQYFLIELEQLPPQQEIFSFNLFIYNPLNDQYSIFLHANSPLTDDKREFIKLLEQKGGALAISLNQKRTFLLESKLDPKDIPGLTPYAKHPLEKARDLYIKALEHKREKRPAPFIGKIELKRAIVEDNYLPLIEEAHDEILTFPVNKSSTVSLAIFLTEKLLVRDNITNRIVAFCYFIAKELQIKDEQTQAELVCAAFLHHLGFTQLNRALINAPYLFLQEREKSHYRRHLGLSQHLLKKIQLDISDNVMRIILEHHERADGKGYPYMKTDKSIYLPAQILGAVSHLFEYSAGKISGEKYSIHTVLTQFTSGMNALGLEKNFSPSIIEVFESIKQVTEEQLNSEGDTDGIKS